jgi:hypothetical protein
MAWVLIVWDLGAGALYDARVDVETVTTRVQAIRSPDHRQMAHKLRAHHRHFSPKLAIERTLALGEQEIVDRQKLHVARYAQQPQEKPPACLH